MSPPPAPLSLVRKPEIFPMKKRAEFDLDAECNFSDLPQEQIETACKYEYMRESQAFSKYVTERWDDGSRVTLYNNRKLLRHVARRLSQLCRAECPKRYELQQRGSETAREYRIYCAHCDKAVNLSRSAIAAITSSSPAGRRRRVLPSFGENMFPSETFRLVLALQKAGFPKPWNRLNKNARQELVSAISDWDDQRKKCNPPILIEETKPERNLERESEIMDVGRVPHVPFPIWRLEPLPGRELGRDWGPSDRRKYFFGFIRIDEGYNETEAVKAFRAWFKDHWRETKGGGSPKWQAKLNDLVVMRVSKRFRDDPIKRVEHIVKFTIPGSKRVGFKGCKEWWKDRCRAKKAKLGFVNGRLSKATNEEMSKARADALKFFQSLFPGERPLSWLQPESS